MTDEFDLEIFLYIFKNEYQIIVFNKTKSENIYIAKTKIEDDSNIIDTDHLKKFLNQNIYKIEKIIGYFIKNITLIIENDQNLNVKIGIKKNYSDNETHLQTNLVEIKNLFKENYQEQNIMHMVILNISHTKKKNLEFSLRTNDQLLEVSFISISNDLSSIFERLLEKYQIKISKYMCGYYIRNFSDNNDDISLKTYQLKEGYNDNEVMLIPKNDKSSGFFERFFHLFS